MRPLPRSMQSSHSIHICSIVHPGSYAHHKTNGTNLKKWWWIFWGMTACGVGAHAAALTSTLVWSILMIRYKYKLIQSSLLKSVLRYKTGRILLNSDFCVRLTLHVYLFNGAPPALTMHPAKQMEKKLYPRRAANDKEHIAEYIKYMSQLEKLHGKIWCSFYWNYHQHVIWDETVEYIKIMFAAFNLNIRFDMSLL